jgi:hypothetical protein
MKRISSIEDLDMFYNRVKNYLHMEYDSKYYKKLDLYLGQLIDLIKSYYWGGNNVPDTAAAVVDYVNSDNIK